VPVDRVKVYELYRAAFDLPADLRSGFLREQCQDDSELHNAVEKLLALASEFGDTHHENDGRRILSEAEQPSLPESVGPYQILAQIGEGGYGTVYRARQTEPVRREVAVKVIKLGLDTRQTMARFQAERQALAMLDHPNIAQILDAGATQEGRPYFVMELVRGEKITKHCDRFRLSIRERLELFRQVCQAVQHAHDRGIIHRDLKPSNVMVAQSADQRILKIIDFGIAKAIDQRLTENTYITEHGQFIGTPEYMSPEQAGNVAEISIRSDIYTLGVLLYELLCGQLPFDSQMLRAVGFSEIQRIIRDVEPPKPSLRYAKLPTFHESTIAARNRQMDSGSLRRQLGGELDCIVMKCLEKGPGNRYASASMLAAEITRALNHEPILARPPSLVRRTQKLLWRNRRRVALIAAITTALISGLLGLNWGLRASPAVEVTSTQSKPLTISRLKIDNTGNRVLAYWGNQPEPVVFASFDVDDHGENVVADAETISLGIAQEQRVVIAFNRPLSQQDTVLQIYALNGTVLAGQTYTLPDPHDPNRIPSRPWPCSRLLTAELDGIPGDELLLVLNHWSFSSSYILLLDPRDGVELDRIYNPGHTNGLIRWPDYFQDGRDGIVLWSQNNLPSGLLNEPGGRRPTGFGSRCSFTQVPVVWIAGIKAHDMAQGSAANQLSALAYSFLDRSSLMTMHGNPIDERCVAYVSDIGIARYQGSDVLEVLYKSAPTKRVGGFLVDRALTAVLTTPAAVGSAKFDAPHWRQSWRVLENAEQYLDDVSTDWFGPQ
jgi:serine/threonine protein kinase